MRSTYKDGRSFIFRGWSAARLAGGLPLDDVCLSLLNMLYLQTLPFLQSGNREEVSDVDYLLNLLVAVIANVGGSLISKWLDNHHKKGK